MKHILKKMKRNLGSHGRSQVRKERRIGTHTENEPGGAGSQHVEEKKTPKENWGEKKKNTDTKQNGSTSLYRERYGQNSRGKRGKGEGQSSSASGQPKKKGDKIGKKKKKRVQEYHT